MSHCILLRKIEIADLVISDLSVITINIFENLFGLSICIKV